MATTKKRVAKKKVATKTAATKAVSLQAGLRNTKLHAVLGQSLMADYEKECMAIGENGMTKSEVARLLCEAFACGIITIVPPKVLKSKVRA